MPRSNMNLLRKHTQDHVTSLTMLGSVAKILKFRNSSLPMSTAKMNAHESDLIGDVDNSTSEREARVARLAKQAIEKLKIADARVQYAESELRAANAEIREFRDKLDKEIDVRMRELETLMEKANFSMAAAEEQLKAAEERVRAAELRACEAESALTHFEEAVRTQILESVSKLMRPSRDSLRAA